MEDQNAQGQGPDQPEEEKIQWHEGFYGAVEWELRAFRQDLTFETEHELSKKPLRVDLLIIKKNRDVKIDTSYARAFRRFNVIEYKSPEDSLTIDDFYKTIGYAMLYKGLGEHVNEVPSEELTVSLFRYGRPRNLFQALAEEAGITVEETYPGVYAVSGFHIPVQIVVSKELTKEEQSALRLLTRSADEEETIRFVRSMESLTVPGDRNNARAALEVIAAANLKLFARIGREVSMEQVMRAIFGDEWDRRWNEGLKQGLERGREQGLEQGLERGRQEARKQYEAVLADKDRALEETLRELRELKLRYGLM